MDLSSSWIDVDTPAGPNSMCDFPVDCCPIPVFRPACAPVAKSVHEMRQFTEMHARQRKTEPLEMHRSLRDLELPEMHRSLRDSEIKTELHRVLQSIQCSSDFGVYFCESFRDPRRHYIDDYWTEVCHESFGVEELHHLVGRVDNAPLPEESKARLHEFARLLDRLARRIDRAVLA